MVQSFTARKPLLAATGAFVLGRRRCSSPQQCFRHCLRTVCRLYRNLSKIRGRRHLALNCVRMSLSLDTQISSLQDQPWSLTYVRNMTAYCSTFPQKGSYNNALWGICGPGRGRYTTTNVYVLDSCMLLHWLNHLIAGCNMNQTDYCVFW